MSPLNKLPNPPELPPRLLIAELKNFPTSPERTFDNPEKNPSKPDPDDDEEEGRLVVGRVNEDPPKVVSSP